MSGKRTKVDPLYKKTKRQRSDVGQHKARNKNTECSVVKCSLKSFCQESASVLPWDSVLKDTNKAVAEAYILANLRVVRLCQAGRPIPVLDQEFYYQYLSAVSVGLTARKKVDDEDLRQSVELYKSWRDPNVSFASSAHIKVRKQRVGITGKERYELLRNVLAPTYAGSDERVLEFRRWIPRNAEGYINQEKPHLILPVTYRFLQFIEQENYRKREGPRYEQLRSFCLLPLKRGFECSHFKMCKLGLYALLRRAGIQIPDIKRKEGQPCWNDVVDEWWHRLFKITKFETENRKFAGEISTDGKAVSIVLRKPNQRTNTLVGFGNWSATDYGGFIKKCPAGPVKKLEKELKRYCVVESVPEFRTSKLHADCHRELTYQYALRTCKDGIVRRVKVYSVLHCPHNGCFGMTHIGSVPSAVMENPSLERTFRGHKSAVTGVSFHPNVQQVASSSLDGVVMIWNFKPQLRAFRFRGHSGPVHAVSFSPTGDVLASASQDRTVRLWTPTVRGDSVVIKAHAGAVRSVSFSSSGRELLTASDDMALKVWALPTRRFRCSLTGHSNWVRSARFSADARRIASGSDDKTVKLWDTEARRCLHTFYEHAGIVNSVAFHPTDNGNTLASCSYDRSVNLWDTRAGRLVHHYKAHDASATSVAFHPTGNYLLSTSHDNSIKLWDVREGQVLYTLQGHDGAVNCAEFSSDCKLLASGAVDSCVLIWEADLDKCLQIDRPPPQVEATSAVDEQRRNGRSKEESVDSSASSQVDTGRRPAAETPAASPPPTPTATPLPTPQQKPRHPYAASKYEMRPTPTISPMKSPSPSASAAQPPPAPLQMPTTPGSEPRSTSSREGTPTSRVNGERYSMDMNTTLQHIVGQLEIITRTLSVLERRISINEDRICDMAKAQKELLERQKQQSARRPDL
ncbi:hypothetical protein BBJ28_00010591 [Nothophytophthora sp. Chile5]|nr:hypothetical protein BBJ28_00010591 [Nothophytophthora sp. Chile5]